MATPFYLKAREVRMKEVRKKEWNYEMQIIIQEEENGLLGGGNKIPNFSSVCTGVFFFN